MQVCNTTLAKSQNWQTLLIPRSKFIEDMSFGSARNISEQFGIILGSDKSFLVNFFW